MWFEASLVLFLVVFVTASILRNRSESGPSALKEEENLIVTYSKTVPGYEVKRIFGYVESSVVFPKEGEVYSALAEEEVVEKLVDRARKKGANAILELTLEREDLGTHTRIKARGLAVRV